jgi:hypothetical protein
MPSKIQVDQIAGATGSTVTLPSGQTLDLSSGTVTLPSTALSALNASNLTSGTVPSARLSLTSSDLPTVPTTKGGTGLTTIGTASQVLRVNSGATALEFGTVSSKLKQFVAISDNTEYATNTGTTPTAVQGTAADLTITPSSASSRILVCYNWGAIQSHTGSNLGYGVIRFKVGGGSFGDVSPVGANVVAGSSNAHFAVTLESQGYQARPITYGFIHHPNTTSAVVYRPFFWTEGATGVTYINRTERDGSSDVSAVMFAYAIEIENN